MSAPVTWSRVGAVTICPRHWPRFPDVPPLPGLYRIRLPDGRAYIGEGGDLRRRLLMEIVPVVRRMREILLASPRKRETSTCATVASVGTPPSIRRAGAGACRTTPLQARQ